MREKGGLERSLANYKGLETGFSDAETLLELGDEMGDPDTLLEAEQSLLALVPMVRDAEIEQMFGEKFDDANAIIIIAIKDFYKECWRFDRIPLGMDTIIINSIRYARWF
jgi:hypothetical protein